MAEKESEITPIMNARALIAIHNALNTGVHGVGGSTVCSETEAAVIAIAAISADFAVGDILVCSSDAPAAQSGTTYVRQKEIRIYKAGTLRIKFDLSAVYAEYTAYGLIYRNGEAVGTEQSTDSIEFVTFSEDIAGWNVGDLVQLYSKSSNTKSITSKNFRLYADRGHTGFDMVLE